MRELVENTVYKNFTAGLNEIYEGVRGTPLEAYLMPMEELNYEERDEWLTEFRLRDIRKLITLLSNEQLFLCLAHQHAEKFR